ncbi:MAG: protein kinase [Pseudobdellovibrionaceae bacterium]|nr:protein kinase [Pseudobdellovibrionaceae bacterium]
MAGMQKQLVGNRYRIKGLIGEGGMASVYAALDEKLDRRVAIKILHQHLARNPDIRERFLLEAKTVSNLDHPNIIKVYDFSGLDSEQLWMVSEILYGVDLAEYVKRYPKNRLHPVVAILIAREVCRALHEAHKLNIVHRDIKPENIMLLDTGQVKLMDFGIAKVHRAKATQTGTFMGSPSYMSPEQIRGSDVDVRADIYSLSVLFYEIVTGVLPYSGQTTAEVINKIMVGRYTAANLLAPELPFVINEIINKGMKSSKEERFQDILDMSSALDEFLRGFGFGESSKELEQYTNNRMAFDERLAKLKMPKTTVPKIESHKNILDQSKPHSSRSHHTSVNRDGVDPNAETKALTGPKPSRAGTTPPRAARPADGNHQNTGPRGHAPQQKHMSHRPGTSHDMPTQILPQQPAPTQSPVRSSATVPPQSQQSRHRTPPQKVVIREVGGFTRRKKSSSSTYVLFGLIAAIVLVFIFGGDRLMNQVKRDGSRVAQQIDPLKQKKAGGSRTETSVAKSTRTDTLPVEMPTTPLVESQTVVIDNSKPPAVSDKETATFKSGRPVVTTNKTLNTPARPKIAALPPQDTSRVKTGTNPPPAQPVPDPTPATETRSPVLASVPEKTTVTDRLPPEPPKKGEPGILRVSALPAAEIFIDGKPYGTTNDPEIAGQGIRLDPGSYSLRLKRKGYRLDEQQVQIKANEQRNVNVTLLKTVDLVELNIRSNRNPAQLVIEDLKDGGRRKEMNMTKSSLILNLRPGTYRVVVTFEQEVVSRVFELRENEGSQTFTADFK